MSPTKKVFGYVRVSKVAGREGDSFISPDVQRQSIERWAREHEAEVIEIVEELDVSGGKKASERALGHLIERCLGGEADGIVTWRLSRFGRSLQDVVNSVATLTDAGKRFVAVEDGVDTAARGSALVLSIFAGLAQTEREARAEGWSDAIGRAILRGTHVGPTPIGYVRKIAEDGVVRLGVADDRTAGAIHEAFVLRGQGKSLQTIADYLTEAGVLPLKRNGKAQSVAWSRTGISALLKNRVYLGEVASQGHVREGAHPAIVTPDEFSSAQRVAGRHPSSKPQGGRTAVGPSSKAFLVSLVHCSACGKRMVIASSSVKGRDERVGNYYCRAHHASGECPSPAVATVTRLEEYVSGLLLDRLATGGAGTATTAALQYRAAEDRVQAARNELDAFLGASMAGTLGAERYRVEVTKRQTALDEAEVEWAEALRTMEARGAAPADVLKRWDSMDIDEKRRTIRAHVVEVRVEKADPKRRRWQPIEERVEVEWRD